MKTNLLCAVVALALVAPLGMVQAQDVQLASHAELNDLYARLAELESRIAASNVSGGCGCADAVGSGCNDGCDDCCDCPGAVAGVEFLWLKAFNSNALFGDFNYEDGFRWWLGYQGASGLGVRARGFAWGKTAPNGDFVDINTIDLEIYDSVQLGCNWDVVIGGGLRYTDASFANNFGEVTAERQIFGTGPVVTAELYRHVSDRAALFIIGRESIVAGDGNASFAPPPTDDTMFISEIQLGGQLHREYNGGLLFARLAWEAQYYDDTYDIGESVTLMGVGASIGLMR